ncbi:hypothetical protein [Lentzea terrae]|uniref:hypothetical protein n=1 Tax=Lentzea terrae TaxID=2200761 RepID=UPI000DD318F1|nr:hypothetical protein [Lentzea terrae]
MKLTALLACSAAVAAVMALPSTPRAGRTVITCALITTHAMSAIVPVHREALASLALAVLHRE